MTDAPEEHLPQRISAFPLFPLRPPPSRILALPPLLSRSRFISMSDASAAAAGGGAVAAAPVVPAPFRPLWKGAPVVAVSQFSRAHVETVVATAAEMERIVDAQGKANLLAGKVLANIFYEPSTRTSSSFHAAMLRLGGDVIPIASSSSSAKKGETLADTLRCLACYVDVVVLRHPEPGSSAVGARVLDVPILNAGDGPNEHPTQALLDVFTIHKEQQRLDNLTVTMVGDLKYGRTVHSLTKLLALFSDITINFVAPAELQIPVEYTTSDSGVTTHASTELTDDILAATDVLYVTRIQKERFEDTAQYERLQGSFVITNATLAKMKPTAAIMHPLPRVGEILEEVDADPRAAYFRQMRNGMFTRMALLKLVLLGEDVA